MMGDLKDCCGVTITGSRLVNSKFPPIAIFADVASADEFETLFAIQALTNPRLLNELGNLDLIARKEIPFGITGCAYATAPFTHINPAGSRFSSGAFGVLYIADNEQTACLEVKHHQNIYWSQVEGMNYERFVFRALQCVFNDTGMMNASVLPYSDPIYHANDYRASHALGHTLKQASKAGLQYNSVRAQDALCWALFTPLPVQSVIQTAHYEMIWNGSISSTNRITNIQLSSTR
jgi:hypothetical protein